MPAPVDPLQAMAPDAEERRPARRPKFQHDSALEAYAGHEESSAPGWTEANERVGEIGGWREYAKELYTPAPEPTPLDPAEATAPRESEPVSVPSTPKATLEYDSVLADYAAYEESEGPMWIEANERVGEIGGWREYAKELYEPTPAMADDGDAR